MVCSVGSVKMAVLARLPTSDKFTQGVTEKDGHQKLVVQYIQKELLEADDANLLDEEDMHVFGLNTLTDPLRLVCCNFCKKPVKASQFVIHAELCRSLGLELLSELDSGAGNRKPPRKERKKSVTTGKRVTPTGVQERFATVDGSETAVSSFQLDEQFGATSSCFVKATGTPGTIAGSTWKNISLTKRPKLIAADTAQCSDDIQTVRGVNNIISFHDAISFDVPTPLAAKTYYSQRNNRLQTAISHMYYQALTKQCCMSERQWRGNQIILKASSSGVLPEEHFDDQFKKQSCFPSIPFTQNANQVYRQGSAVSLINAGGQASDKFVNELSTIDAYTSLAAADGGFSRQHRIEAKSAH